MSPGDALLAQPPLGVDQQALEDPLARLVVGDEVDDVVALGRRVLRVAADVEVEPGAVAQEDVAAAAPGHDPAEQVAGDLVGRQPPLAVERARDAVLVLEAEDPPVHVDHLMPRETVHASIAIGDRTSRHSVRRSRRSSLADRDRRRRRRARRRGVGRYVDAVTGRPALVTAAIGVRCRRVPPSPVRCRHRPSPGSPSSPPSLPSPVPSAPRRRPTEQPGQRAAPSPPELAHLGAGAGPGPRPRAGSAASGARLRCRRRPRASDRGVCSTVASAAMRPSQVGSPAPGSTALGGAAHHHEAAARRRPSRRRSAGRSGRHRRSSPTSATTISTS